MKNRKTMYNLKQLQQIIEEKIKEIKYPSNAKELYDPIKYILSIGGKRIRPALTLASCNLFCDNIDSAVNPAIGIEVFHNFTLIHDDIMDQSVMRRNNPTVHKKWDTNTAILSGDAMSIIAYQFIEKSPENKLRKVLNVFNQTALRVCEGQQLDMNFEKRQNVTIPEYLKMIELKTSELIAGSLKTGAICGNATNKDAELLYYFGKNIGLAFQLQDDYLDVYADEKTFGKKIGNDIVSNKKTYLLIQALQNSDKTLKQELQTWLNKKSFDKKEKITKVKEIFNELKVKEKTQEEIKKYYRLALEYLDKIGIDPERKQTLFAFVKNISERTF